MGVDEGHRFAAQKRMASLNDGLREAEKLGLMTPEVHALHLRQILNGIEGQILKAREEMESLKERLAREQGRIRGLERMGTLMINIVSAHNAMNAEPDEHPDEGIDGLDDGLDGEPEATKLPVKKKAPTKRARRGRTQK